MVIRLKRIIVSNGLINVWHITVSICYRFVSPVHIEPDSLFSRMSNFKFTGFRSLTVKQNPGSFSKGQVLKRRLAFCDQSIAMGCIKFRLASLSF